MAANIKATRKSQHSQKCENPHRHCLFAHRGLILTFWPQN